MKDADKIKILEKKIDELNSKLERVDFEKFQFLLYFNLLIGLTLLAFVIGAVVKQLG